MKKLVINSFIIVALAACQPAKQHNEASSNEGDSEGTSLVSQKEETFSIKGQWYTKGNAGLEPYWIEFRPESKEYFEWLAEGNMPDVVTGTYKLEEGNKLTLHNDEYDENIVYKLQVIDDKSLTLVPMGPSAGNLTFLKENYSIQEE